MDIIREYLIALGWKIDDGSWKRFQNAVAMTTKVTGEVGSVALETATAVELMVARIARQYESLYYVSQRTYQSVGFLQASQFGFRQIGLSADQALGSIENVAATLRQNPWLSAIFGGARTPQQIADVLSHSGLPYFVQARLAGLVGLDEQTLFHLEKFGAQEKQQSADFAKRQREAGIDPDALAKRLAAPEEGSFIWALNRLESEFDILGEKIAQTFVDPVQEGINLIQEAVHWFNVNASVPDVAFSTLATTAVGGWIGTRVLKGVLGALGITKAGATATKAATAVDSVGAGAAGAEAASAFSLARLLALRNLIAVGFGVELALDLIDKIEAHDQSGAAPDIGREKLFTQLPWYRRAAIWTQEHIFGADPNTLAPDVPGYMPPRGTPTASRITPAIADRLNETIAFFQQHGYSADAARGIAASLFFESGKTLDPHAFNPAGGGRGASGVGQWRGARAEQFQRLFGHDLSRATLQEELEFVLWEMHKGNDFGARRAGGILSDPNISASRAAETFLNLYERPGPGGANEISNAADFAAGLAREAANVHVDRSVTLHSKTDIHLTGDAKNAAAKVAGAQDQVNGTLVRNLQGAVR